MLKPTKPGGGGDNLKSGGKSKDKGSESSKSGDKKKS